MKPLDLFPIQYWEEMGVALLAEGYCLVCGDPYIMKDGEVIAVPPLPQYARDWCLPDETGLDYYHMILACCRVCALRALEVEQCGHA